MDTLEQQVGYHQCEIKFIDTSKWIVSGGRAQNIVPKFTKGCDSNNWKDAQKNYSWRKIPPSHGTTIQQ